MGFSLVALFSLFVSIEDRPLHWTLVKSQTHYPAAMGNGGCNRLCPAAMGNGGCNRLCPAAMGFSLIALFSLFMSIEDRPLHWTLVKSQTHYPEHIHAYGSGKACYSPVMGFGSFRTDWLEVGIGGGLRTALRPGLNYGGLESKFGRGPSESP
jgi:hypothetical protein